MGLNIGVVQQPIAGERHSGDAYWIDQQGSETLVVAIDGLGHGVEAEQAAQLAVRFIQAHRDWSPAALLEGAHLALRGSRGAVMAIVRIDHARGVAVHAGIGNVEARVINADRVRRPVSSNGIVGHTMRKVREESLPFEKGDMLIMHSDGISDRFELSAHARERDPQMLANQLALAHGRAHDDQLILVVREAS